MKPGLDINWDKVRISDYELGSIVHFGIGDLLFLDADLIAAFDEMLEHHMTVFIEAKKRYWSWNDETGWYFDENKLDELEREIFEELKQNESKADNKTNRSKNKPLSF